MAAVLTVSQLTSYISSKIKFDGKLKGIAVKGEISNLSCNYKSGHMYFSLKEGATSIRAVMFASSASRLRFTVQNGMDVMAMGNIDVYERDGVYQLITTEIIPAGAGAAHIQLEQLKAKLASIGVFDTAGKMPIPKMPKHIAVVTSLDAAALQDILKVLQRRYPICRVTIVPTPVQGDKAGEMIAKAIESADNLSVDTIIAARGGGSAEDLSAFNSEPAVMAVYNCKTPIISAIGHETDTSLCDLAADLRAPTPSAAAELCVPDMSAIKNSIAVLENRLSSSMRNKFAASESQLDRCCLRLYKLSPSASLERQEKAFEKLHTRLKQAIINRLSELEKKAELETCKLSALSPLHVLSRGYSVVKNSEGKVISSAKLTYTGDIISIIMADGEISAVIE